MAALATISSVTPRRRTRTRPAPLLELNGLTFAHVQCPAGQRPAGISGLYAVRRGGVLLMEPDGTPFALACGNADGGEAWRGPGFFVSASRLEDGRLWFGFSTSEQTDRRLGLQVASFSQARAAAHSLLDQARCVATRWNPHSNAQV